MKKLELFFENEDGKTVKFTLDKPVEPVNVETVIEVMNTIINENIFYSTGGDLVKRHRARLVDNVVEEINVEN